MLNLIIEIYLIMCTEWIKSLVLANEIPSVCQTDRSFFDIVIL